MAHHHKGLIAYEIYTLLRLGFPEDVILQGVEMLAKLSWSSKPVEEGHASASCIMKMHRLYGEETMDVRSMLGQPRALLNTGALQSKESQLENELARLRRKTG